MTMSTTPLGYSINDAIAASSIKRTKLYELINSGELQTVKVGKRTVVKADSLRRLMEGAQS